MKKYSTGIILLFLISSCTGQKYVQSGAYNMMLNSILSNSVKIISVDSLQHVQNNVELLDARSPEEYNVSHIKNARFVGYKNFDSTAVAALNKSTPLVVYCSVGYRSEKISEKLKKMGFTDVSNLYGGIFEWKNEGHKIVNENGPTEKIHAYNKRWGIWLTKGEKVYE